LFTVAPTSTPVSPLTLQISWDGTDIGDVSPQTLVFTDKSPQQVVVTGTHGWLISDGSVHVIIYTLNILSIDLADCCSGLRNPSNMSIDRNSTLQVRVISGEHAYAGISSSLLVTDKDIHWPQCTLILPYTVPLIGKNITLYGMITEHCFNKTDVCIQPTICSPTSLLVLNSSSIL